MSLPSRYMAGMAASCNAATSPGVSTSMSKGRSSSGRWSRAGSTYLAGISRHPLIAHRLVENHAQDGQRLVYRARADLRPLCPLLRVGLCVTRPRGQDACVERLLGLRFSSWPVPTDAAARQRDKTVFPGWRIRGRGVEARQPLQKAWAEDGSAALPQRGWQRWPCRGCSVGADRP